MVIENLREMSKYNAERLAVAPSCQGGGTPAAGASPRSPLRGLDLAICPQTDIGSTLISGTDRRDRERSHRTSLFTSPILHEYSNDVPCPASHSSSNYRPLFDSRLHHTDRHENHSAHGTVIVDMSNSVLNTCAREDTGAFEVTHGTNISPSSANAPSCPDAGIIHYSRHMYSLKGATA